MVKRLVRYCMQTDTGEQVSMRHKWTFAVVNQPREIERIGQRVLAELSPASDLIIHYEAPIPKSKGLSCKVFSLSSDVGEIIDTSNIYASKNFRRDRALETTRDELGWGKYVDNLVN